MPKSVKRVVVSGGGGQIAYNALFRIASGEMLGADQPIELHILEIPEAQKILDGVIMELEDCAYPLLKGVRGYVNPYEAFKGCDIALLIGAKPRGPGMERKDLLSENATIFMEQGKALNDGANKGALVFVVGNPCNTNALITLHHAPKIDKKRIFAMTRLDENRAKAQLAKKANVAVDQIKRMAIWGNHSSTQVPDFLHAQIDHQPLSDVISERKWLENEFVSLVQKRGAQVIGARGKSSAASAAHAMIGSIQVLLNPTPKGDWFSVGVYTEGNPYGIQSNLIFSFPCRSFGEGRVEIISDLEWDPFLKEKIRLSEEELIQERQEIQTLL